MHRHLCYACSALAWTNELQRRAVLVKYQSANNNWGGGAIDPAERWAAQTVAGMTEAEYAVMRGPERDGAENTVPRLEVLPGATEVVVRTDTNDSYASKVALKTMAKL